jgi:hypothetical protein
MRTLQESLANLIVLIVAIIERVERGGKKG